MNTPATAINTREIPFEIKEKLVLLARKLPEAARSEFVRGASRKIHDVASDHPRTFIYAAAGWMLGELIDHVLSIHIPLSDVVICLTADKASEVGVVAGALFGFYEDTQRQAERRQVAKIIGEELRAANAARA